jgi:hypothetical protein
MTCTDFIEILVGPRKASQITRAERAAAHAHKAQCKYCQGYLQACVDDFLSTHTPEEIKQAIDKEQAIVTSDHLDPEYLQTRYGDQS